jgi:hypothetical protein
MVESHSMRWNKPYVRGSSLHGLIGRDAPASTAWVRDQQLEEVRRAMIGSLSGFSGCEVARMNIRLRYAGDIEALWYLRTDLLGILAPLQGEPYAKNVMAQVTLLFQGLLPRALGTPVRASLS